MAKYDFRKRGGHGGGGGGLFGTPEGQHLITGRCVHRITRQKGET